MKTDMKELFENNCFPMSWSEETETYTPQRKDLSVLLAELEEIKNNLDEIEAKQWYLAKRAKLHKEGIAFE